MSTQRTAPAFHVIENMAARKIFQVEGFRFFFFEGLSRNFSFLDKFSPNDFIYAQLAWHSPGKFFEHERAIISQFPNIDPEKITFLGNTEHEVEAALRCGFRAVFCNHNAWIDFNLFCPDGGPEKKYDFVINSRPELWKRPYLARKVSELAIIKGYNFRKHEYFELKSLKPKYINENRLNQTEVADLLRSAYVGGSFSEEEGACYSSSEMLLCGLPVVSTKSRGGRDVFYDSNNSVIVEPNENEVAQAALLLKERILRGDISSEAIHQRHRALSLDHRARFLGKFIENASHFGLDLSQVTLQDLYSPKMVTYIPQVNADAYLA